jgi:hypothetical protein
MSLSEIAELCDRFRDVVDEFPFANEEIVIDAVMARLDRAQLIALAAEWIGMGGSWEHDASTNARAFVEHFVRAMGTEHGDE